MLCGFAVLVSFFGLILVVELFTPIISVTAMLDSIKVFEVTFKSTSLVISAVSVSDISPVVSKAAFETICAELSDTAVSVPNWIPKLVSVLLRLPLSALEDSISAVAMARGFTLMSQGSLIPFTLAGKTVLQKKFKKKNLDPQKKVSEKNLDPPKKV